MSILFYEIQTASEQNMKKARNKMCRASYAHIHVSDGGQDGCIFVLVRMSNDTWLLCLFTLTNHLILVWTTHTNTNKEIIVKVNSN